jgi:class 3 adenylate cyclase
MERRLVTVLFADLVGFTSLSERLDPEDLATLQDAYFEAVRGIVGRYGGSLEKFIGDAAVACYGVPLAREDDAERAVRTGLALTAAVERVGAELGLDPGELRLRVGINTGEVAYATAGPDRGRLSGDTVNVAARLQTAAEPGGVLIGQPTAMAVVEIAELVEGAFLELKGKAAPVQAFLVSGLRAEPSRERAMGALRAPMVGREVELDLLCKAVLSTTASERFTVVAPPGVGKSRLLRELAGTLADDGATCVLLVRLRSDLVSPHQLVRELLTAGLGAPSSLEDTVAVRLHEALEHAGHPPAGAEVVTAHALRVLCPGTEANLLEASGDRETVFAAWIDAVDALCHESASRSAWMVEDVHWAGDDSLEWLDMAAKRPGACRRLVLSTARPNLLAEQPSWCTDDGASLLQLEPLSAEQTSQLVHKLVGDALTPHLAATVCERAAGNPLFVEELLRSWIASGVLVADKGTWQLARDPGEVELPATVRAVYAAQLDDLPLDARTLVRRCAVAGRRFPAAAFPALGIDGADLGLETLLRRALVSGPYAEPGAGPVYSFRHALLRDAAYASLAKAERVALHVRLARWLEEAVVDSWPEAAEVIGGHYAAAIEHAPRFGPDFGGISVEHLRGLAGRWLERAAELASGAAADRAAAELFRRSIELCPAAPPLELARRRFRLGEITAHSLDMTAGAVLLEQACRDYAAALSVPSDAGERGSMARHAGDDAVPDARLGYAMAVAALARVRYEQLAFDEGAALCASALERLGEAEGAATAHLLAAHAQCVLGGSEDHSTAVPELHLALRLAGDARLELAVTELLANAEPRTYSGAAAAWRQVEELARSVGDWPRVARALYNEALHLLGLDVGAAREVIEQANGICATYGLAEQAAWLEYLRAEAGLLDGRWDDAVSAGDRAIASARTHGFDRVQIRTWFVLAPIAAARRDRDAFARLHDFVASLHSAPDSPYARIVLAALELRLADAGYGEVSMPEVAPRLNALDSSLDQPSWVAAVERVVEAWLAAGELEAVRHVLFSAVAARRREGDSLLARPAEALVEARLARAEDRLADAELAARSAAGAARSAGIAWWQLQALDLLADLQAASPAELRQIDSLRAALGIPRDPRR